MAEPEPYGAPRDVRKSAFTALPSSVAEHQQLNPASPWQRFTHGRDGRSVYFNIATETLRLDEPAEGVNHAAIANDDDFDAFAEHVPAGSWEPGGGDGEPASQWVKLSCRAGNITRSLYSHTRGGRGGLSLHEPGEGWGEERDMSEQKESFDAVWTRLQREAKGELNLQSPWVAFLTTEKLRAKEVWYYNEESQRRQLEEPEEGLQDEDTVEGADGEKMHREVYSRLIRALDVGGVKQLNFDSEWVATRITTKNLLSKASSGGGKQAGAAAASQRRKDAGPWAERVIYANKSSDELSELAPAEGVCSVKVMGATMFKKAWADTIVRAQQPWAWQVARHGWVLCLLASFALQSWLIMAVATLYFVGSEDGLGFLGEWHLHEPRRTVQSVAMLLVVLLIRHLELECRAEIEEVPGMHWLQHGLLQCTSSDSSGAGGAGGLKLKPCNPEFEDCVVGVQGSREL